MPASTLSSKSHSLPVSSLSFINAHFLLHINTRNPGFIFVEFVEKMEYFEDFFPTMVEKLGAEGFMKELCNGFGLLVDGDKGVITFESLKRNSKLLGLREMNDEDIMCMMKEGDLDGDGALSQTEFCILMCRLSPDLMKTSRKVLEDAIVHEM